MQRTGRQVLWALPLVLWGLATCYPAVAPAAEGEEEAAEAFDFEGRIVVVNFKSREDTVEYLKEVELREIAGRTCLVGVAVDSGFEEDRWVVDAQVIIGWDEVSYLYSLTPEQYQEMLKGSDSVIAHQHP